MHPVPTFFSHARKRVRPSRRIAARALLLILSLSLIPLASVTSSVPVANVAGSLNMWASAEELASAPTSGDAWNAVKSAADKDTSNPDPSNQDDNVNVYVLAAGIVYARTGDAAYKTKVVNAIDKIVAGGNPGDRTLAWAREVGAYALAADLVGYRPSAALTWFRKMAEEYVASDGRTLLSMFRERPNNWGTHAFGSLVAIYRYIGDTTKLQQVRDYWVKGVIGPNPGYKYGSDTSWHCSTSNLLQINPKGCTKSGMNIDGLLPDDMRRGCSFKNPPCFTGYPWEAIQGLVSGARILERAGMPIWDVADKAIYRAAYALQVRLGGEWKAEGDDLWMLPFLDKAYGTSWSGSQSVWGYGKNVGFGYVVTGSDSGGTDPSPSPTPDETTEPSPSPSPSEEPSPSPSPSPSEEPGTVGTVTFTPVADARVNRKYPSKNYGTQTTLRVRSGSFRSYLKFDVANVSGTVTKAVLRLYASDGSPDSGSVYTTSTSWTEKGITWNNQPGLGTKVRSGTSVSSGKWVSLEVTAAVKSNGVVAFVLDSGSSNSAYYHAREYTYKPQLVVTTS